MNETLIKQLKKITPEEEKYMKNASKGLFPYVLDDDTEIIDFEKMTSKRRMISLYKRTRFVDYPDHTHNYLEMIYVCSGSVNQTIDGNTELLMQTDDLLFIRQGVKHRSTIPAYDDLMIHFMILPEFLRYPLGMLTEDTVLRRFIEGVVNGKKDGTGYLHFHLSEMQEAKNLLENMTLSLLRETRNVQQILQVTMGALFLELSNRTYKITVGTPSDYEKNLVLKANTYIEEHYSTATLEEFSKMVNQPAYYISRIMKKYSPYTFTKYVQKRRMIQAAYLLESGDFTIEEIMNQVGYENSSHFHRLFKEEYEMTPKEYRRKYGIIREEK